MSERERKRKDDECVDRDSRDSMDASDPPPRGGRMGAPRRRDEERDREENDARRDEGPVRDGDTNDESGV